MKVALRRVITTVINETRGEKGDQRWNDTDRSPRQCRLVGFRSSMIILSYTKRENINVNIFMRIKQSAPSMKSHTDGFDIERR
jgi:hypothetical protein